MKRALHPPPPPLCHRNSFATEERMMSGGDLAIATSPEACPTAVECPVIVSGEGNEIREMKCKQSSNASCAVSARSQPHTSALLGTVRVRGLAKNWPAPSRLSMHRQLVIRAPIEAGVREAARRRRGVFRRRRQGRPFTAALTYLFLGAIVYCFWYWPSIARGAARSVSLCGARSVALCGVGLRKEPRRTRERSSSRVSSGLAQR